MSDPLFWAGTLHLLSLAGAWPAHLLAFFVPLSQCPSGFYDPARASSGPAALAGFRALLSMSQQSQSFGNGSLHFVTEAHSLHSQECSSWSHSSDGTETGLMRGTSFPPEK